MKTNKKISLIIPVYNTEKYLGQCLSSAINQTYKNMELICVDDGSTDRSGAILDEFAKKDCRMVVIHQENCGQSRARNIGLKACSGDYIGFLDSDDWIEPDMYGSMVEAMEGNDVDLVAVSWTKEFEHYSEAAVNKEKVNANPFGRDELLSYIYKRDAYQGFAYMWNKLCKRETLTDTAGDILTFDENLKCGEDVVYLARACLNVNRGGYIDKNYYHYRQREDSATHLIDLNRRMDWLQAYRYVIGLFEKEKINRQILDFVKRFMAYHSSNTARIAYELKNADCLQECLNIMKTYQQIYENTNIEFPERIERYRRILGLRLGTDRYEADR